MHKSPLAIVAEDIRFIRRLDSCVLFQQTGFRKELCFDFFSLELISECLL